jgi:hypothetical protein
VPSDDCVSTPKKTRARGSWRRRSIARLKRAHPTPRPRQNAERGPESKKGRAVARPLKTQFLATVSHVESSDSFQLCRGSGPERAGMQGGL